MKTYINLLATASLLVVAFISIGGFFSDLDWRLALYSNPRPHFLAAACIALIWFLVYRNKSLVILAALVALINLATLAPLFVPPEARAIEGDAISILHLNTNKGQADLSALADEAADILFLQEVTPTLDQLLPTLFPSYAVAHSQPLSNTHGSAILIFKGEKIKRLSSEIIHIPEHSSRPLIAAEVQVDNRQIHLLNLHTIRPRNRRTDAFQIDELTGVAEWSRQIAESGSHEVMIMGDFNVTPWSNRFYRLLADGRLRDSLRGYGLQNTWPSMIPLVFGLPIDHAVHSDGVVTTSRKVVRVQGTDHAAIFVEFAFAGE